MSTRLAIVAKDNFDAAVAWFDDVTKKYDTSLRHYEFIHQKFIELSSITLIDTVSDKHFCKKLASTRSKLDSAIYDLRTITEELVIAKQELVMAINIFSNVLTDITICMNLPHI